MQSVTLFLIVIAATFSATALAFQRPAMRPVLRTSNEVSEGFGSRKSDMRLYGGKVAKFGIFSPVVYAAKFVLGEAKLNKVKIINILIIIKK